MNTWMLLKITERRDGDYDNNQKISWDFDAQTDSQIPTRRPEMVLLNKKRICHFVDLVVTTDWRVIIIEKKMNKYWDLP